MGPRVRARGEPPTHIRLGLSDMTSRAGARGAADEISSSDTVRCYRVPARAGSRH